MFEIQTNWLAVVLCGVAYMVIGMLWYGPLFGKAWTKLMHWKKADIEKAKKSGEMPKTYSISLLASFVMAYALNLVMKISAISSVSEAVQLAIWLWVGFVAMSWLTLVLFEKKPSKLVAINTGYHLVTMVVMSVILFTVR